MKITKNHKKFLANLTGRTNRHGIAVDNCDWNGNVLIYEVDYVGGYELTSEGDHLSLSFRKWEEPA
ncbi:hypothetical protein [Mesorhizobium sp. A623]